MNRTGGTPPFRSLRFLWSNPEAACLRPGSTTWWGALSSPSDFVRKTETRRIDLSLPDPEWPRIAECVEEGTLACFQDLGEAGSRLFLHRSINSTADLFFLAGSDGSLVITDHFRNAIEGCPAGTLSLTDDWLADLLLFPDMPGNRTVFGPIRRVAHGETVRIDLDSGECRTVHQDRLVPGGETDPAEAPERVLEALDQSLGLFSDRAKKAVLFSGGVDSTLLKWRLGDSSAAVFVGCDSPEFDFERGYAEQSARALGIRPERIEIQEADLPLLSLDALEETAQVFPVTVYQPVFNSRAFREPFSCFLSGDYADILFGFGAVRQVFLPEDEEQERRLRLPAADPGNFAAQTYMTSDRTLAERILGPEAVAKAVETRLDYALRRFSFRSPEGDWQGRQAELASFLVFFTGDWFNRYRQQAFFHGKALHAPFSQRTVLEEALKIPLPGRYLENGELKALLKGILRERVPGAPASGKKGGAGWPRTRLCTTGPFAGFFKRNPVPGFIPERERHRLAKPDWDSSTVTLTCQFLAQWERNFLRNKPGVVPGTREIRFGAKAAEAKKERAPWEPPPAA